MQKAKFWSARGWNVFCVSFTLVMCLLGAVKAAGWM